MINVPVVTYELVVPISAIYLEQNNSHLPTSILIHDHARRLF
jgi:hypothetical protein